MTWREWMTKYLVDRGLWPQEAQEVITYTLAYNESISAILNSPHDGYPPQMDAVVAMCLNTASVEWIDANKPKHFARQMFLATEK